MIISFYLALSWLIVGLLFTTPKPLSAPELVFLILFFILLNENVYVLLESNFKLLSIAKGPVDYIAFLLFRTIVIPITLTIFVNRSFLGKKSIALLCCAIVFFLFELVIKLTHIISYKQPWFLYIALLYFLIQLCLGILIVNWYRKVQLQS